MPEDMAPSKILRKKQRETIGFISLTVARVAGRQRPSVGRSSRPYEHCFRWPSVGDRPRTPPWRHCICRPKERTAGLPLQDKRKANQGAGARPGGDHDPCHPSGREARRRRGAKADVEADVPTSIRRGGATGMVLTRRKPKASHIGRGSCRSGAAPRRTLSIRGCRMRLMPGFISRPPPAPPACCRFFPTSGTNRFLPRSPSEANTEWLRWALAIRSHACRWWHCSRSH